MYPGYFRSVKWLVYLIGCLVFVGGLYFTFSRLAGFSTLVSLAIAIPLGVFGFFVFAAIAEHWESGGWDSGA